MFSVLKKKVNTLLYKRKGCFKYNQYERKGCFKETKQKRQWKKKVVLKETKLKAN